MTENEQHNLPTVDEVLQNSVRIRPTELAKLFGVSKQAVSQWLAKGTISSYPDGSICPKRAAREYMANTDPNRVKASVFKFLTDDVSTFKKTIETLNTKIADQKNYIEALVDAFDTIITTIRDDVADDEFEYLGSLTDRVAIETELNEIINFDFKENK